MQLQELHTKSDNPCQEIRFLSVNLHTVYNPCKEKLLALFTPECHPVAALISQSSLSYFSEPCCTFTYTEKLASAADKKKKKKKAAKLQQVIIN